MRVPVRALIVSVSAPPRILRSSALVYAEPSVLPKSVPAPSARRDLSLTLNEISRSVLSGCTDGSLRASDMKTLKLSSTKIPVVLVGLKRGEANGA